MAKAKGIAYANTTEEQKKRAEKWAKRWGTTPDKCPMHRKTGNIITNREDVPHVSDLDYEIMTKEDGIECLADITDEIREDFLAAMKRDRISDEDREAAKAGLAAMRG